MPTPDNSYTTKANFLNGRVLRVYRQEVGNLPGRIPFQGIQGADSGVVYAAYGNIVDTRQPPTNPRFETSPCCGEKCITLTPVQNVELSYDGNTDNIFTWILTWNPVPEATSYSVSVEGDATLISFTSTGLTRGTLVINWGGSTFTVVITARNECSVSTGSVSQTPCFLAGALITYADGSTKPIEDVKVGDVLLGAFGEHNTVLALHRPLLGDSLIYRINGEHDTSDHHPHISADKKFYASNLATLNEKTYGSDHVVINHKGEEELWHLFGLNKGRTLEMTTGIQLQHVSGPKTLATLETYSLPPETQMYNLAMSGSHTYFVNGYAVTGWPREDDFDYDTWTPKF
jgi:hypothetical protein